MGSVNKEGNFKLDLISIYLSLNSHMCLMATSLNNIVLGRGRNRYRKKRGMCIWKADSNLKMLEYRGRMSMSENEVAQ